MPLELIGWKEVEASLSVISRITETLGINVDKKELEEAYSKSVEQFKKDNGIKSNNDLREQISMEAEFYPSLECQENVLFALSNQGFVSSFVLKENRYHLSTEDKQMLLKNASLIESEYTKLANTLRGDVYKQVRIGREDWKTVVKEDSKYTDEGVSYQSIVDTADWITDTHGKYGYFMFNNAKDVIENEIANTKITESLKSVQTKGKEERKNTIKGLVAEYDLTTLFDYLSDDDLEIVTELKEEEIASNDSIISEKKERINVLTRREQLLKKLSSQENRLKNQENEIHSLDRDIKNLEARQGQK